MKRSRPACMLALFLVLAGGRAPEAKPLLVFGSGYTRQGGVELEGDAGFSFRRSGYRLAAVDEETGEETIVSGDLETVSLRFTPSAGVFVARGLQLGIRPVVLFTRYEYDGAGIAPAAGAMEIGGGADLTMRYVIDTRSRVFPFVGLGAGGLGGRLKDGAGSGTYNLFEVGPELGLKFLFARRGLLTLSFTYWFQSFDMEGRSSREARHVMTFGMGLGFWV